MGVAVSMERPGTPVLPGNEATVEVRIRNTGPVVDQFELDVVGEAASWTHVEPATVNLMPGAEGSATIVFKPPRSSRVPQGPMAYALRVMSREDTEASAIQEAVVEIGAYSQTKGELLPRTSTGRRRGRHQVVLDNLGNHPEVVAVTASDPDLKLDFAISPANATLSPGTATFVKVVAKPQRRFWRGSNVTIPFQVTAASAEGGDPVVLPGSMVQTSILPAWFFKALALAAVAAIALAALWFALLKPTVESTAKNVVEDSNAELARAITDAADQAAEAQEDAEEAKAAAGVEEGAAGAGAGGDDDGDGESGAGGDGEDGAGNGSGGESGGESGDTDTAGAGTGTGTLRPSEAVDFRVITDAPTAGGFTPATFRPEANTSVWVSDLVLQNPSGDTGTLRIQRGDDVLMVFGLENFRDLDYHFIQPTLFTRQRPVVVAVDCTNPDGSNCSASVYFSGRAITERRNRG